MSAGAQELGRTIANWFTTRSLTASPGVTIALACVINAFTGIPSRVEPGTPERESSTEREEAV